MLAYCFSSAMYLKVLYKADDSIIMLLQMGKLIICTSLINGPVTGSELESRSPKSHPGLCQLLTLPRQRSKCWTGEYEMHVLWGSVYLPHSHRCYSFETLLEIVSSYSYGPRKHEISVLFIFFLSASPSVLMQNRLVTLFQWCCKLPFVLTGKYINRTLT